MKTAVNEYQKQAEDFLTKTGATLEITFSHHGLHFEEDTQERDIYTCTLKRGSRSYTFNYGNSLNDSGFYYTKGRQKIDLDRSLLGKKNLGAFIRSKIDWNFLNNGKSDIIHVPKTPDAYDILSCLQKYDVGTFEDFCHEFGYDEDSIRAERLYNAVVKEYGNLLSLFSDEEIEELQEIA